MTKLADELEALAEKATPGPFVCRGKNVLLAGGGKWEATFEAVADRDIFEFYRSNHAAIITALRDVDRLREALKPFADACAKADASSEEVRRAGMGNGHSDDASPGWGIRYKHLKAARAALEPHQ